MQSDAIFRRLVELNAKLIVLLSKPDENTSPGLGDRVLGGLKGAGIGAAIGTGAAALAAHRFPALEGRLPALMRKRLTRGIAIHTAAGAGIGALTAKRSQ